MSGCIEYGKCAICKKDAQLERKYYHYNIVCECCSNQHFEYVAHCKDCIPAEPKTVNITIATSNLERLKDTSNLPKLELYN